MVKNIFLFVMVCPFRFCLQSPDPLVKLWLNIFVLIPDWNRDQSIMYLMDTLIRASFFHLGARAVTENLFQNLFTVRSFRNTKFTFSRFNCILTYDNNLLTYCNMIKLACV